MLTTEKEQAAENFEPKRDGHFDKRVGYYVGEEGNLIRVWNKFIIIFNTGIRTHKHWNCFWLVWKVDKTSYY